MSQSVLGFAPTTAAIVATSGTTSTFTFGTHAVRLIVRDGEPWFVAADVCAALDYANPSKAVADHLDDDERSHEQLDRSRMGSKAIVINESGLYALVLRSRKPEARKFAKWVTGEVLPAIRRTGGYGQQPNIPKPGPGIVEGRREFLEFVEKTLPKEAYREVLQGDRLHKIADGYLAYALGSRRWLIQFDGMGKQVVSPIDSNDCVLKYEDLPRLLLAGDNVVPSELLAAIAKSCVERMQRDNQSMAQANQLLRRASQKLVA